MSNKFESYINGETLNEVNSNELKPKKKEPKLPRTFTMTDTERRRLDILVAYDQESYANNGANYVVEMINHRFKELGLTDDLYDTIDK